MVPENSEILYGEQTKLNLENMSFSGTTLSDFPEYIKAAVLAKKACANANFRAGLLSEEKRAAIACACDLCSAGGYDDQFVVDVFHGGGAIGVNMNLNEVIASLAGAGIWPVDDVNLSQSTSDLCSTALHVALVNETELLCNALEKTTAALSARAGEFADVETVARTCWQDGMKVGLSVLFTSSTSVLQGNIRRLKKLRECLLQVNLGWTVIGTGCGAGEEYRKYVVEELREAEKLSLRWPEAPTAAAQYPDEVVRLSAEVNIVASILMKIAADLRLLASGPETGLGELTLPAVQAGSSFFPGKVNPVVPEMVMQCAMLVDGGDSVIRRTLSMGETYINLWEPMAGFLLLRNVKMLTKASLLFAEKCLAGVKVRREVCKKYSESSIPSIIAYKERYGYQHISKLVKQYGLEEALNILKESGN